MLLSDIKSGMVLEVLQDWGVERYIVCEISGKLMAFNDKRTLGEVDYFFRLDLSPIEKCVELLKVMVITDTEWDVFTAINNDKLNAIKVVWSK